MTASTVQEFLIAVMVKLTVRQVPNPDWLGGGALLLR